MSDQRPTVNVSAVIDNCPVGYLTYLVFGICFLATISDGYALLSASLAAPGIVREFGVSQSRIAPIFSAALFGMLIGASVSGYLGDKYGRKGGMVAALALVCVASFACSAARSLNEIVWIRFVMGLGIGGLLPHVTALMSEFMPKSIRGAFTTYAFMGVTAGGVIAGLLSSEYLSGDWRGLFLAGGLLPLAVLPLAFFVLPESLKFLALHPRRSGELRKWLGKFSPGLVLSQDTAFVLDEAPVKSSTWLLFAGRLRWITPTLWLVFICIMLVNFFINSWIVLVLEGMGFSPPRAAAIASVYHIGGLAGGLLMGLALDYFGAIALALWALMGCGAAALIGLANASQLMTSVLVGAVGFSVLGSQVGMSAIAGLIYPTSVRSRGAGLAQGIGRLGAIAGPLLAGWQLAESKNLLALFLIPIIPLSIAALGFFAISRMWRPAWSLPRQSTNPAAA